MEEITDHANMQVLSSDECFSLLGSVPVGRVAFIAEGGVQLFPVTFVIHDRQIVFRSAMGSKLDAAEMARNVTFEADSWDAPTQSGWSVLATGRVHAVTDSERLAELERLGLDPWLNGGEEMGWIEVHVDEISGRRLPA